MTPAALFKVDSLASRPLLLQPIENVSRYTVVRILVNHVFKVGIWPGVISAHVSVLSPATQPDIQPARSRLKPDFPARRAAGHGRRCSLRSAKFSSAALPSRGKDGARAPATVSAIGCGL